MKQKIVTCISVIFSIFFIAPCLSLCQDDMLQWKNKTIMVFSPHPDDELFCNGAMAKLIKNGNTVRLVIYTNGNKGSLDPEMTSERLAAIRKNEDEAANKIIGLVPENIIWLGYDDGELEYVPEKELTEKVCRLIRLYRPDAIFSYDPGEKYEHWHKTDHRMAAFITVDATRAAPFHLYFPHHKLYEHLEPYTVPYYFFFGSYGPNYWVDLSDVFEVKCEAIFQHSSQFGKGNIKYQPVMDQESRAEVRGLLEKIFTRDGKRMEGFRRVNDLPGY